MTQRKPWVEPKISLEELLSGNQKWEDVIEFFQNGEFDNTIVKAQAIAKYLLTKEQREAMCNHDYYLSIEIMIGGYALYGDPLVQKITKDWDTKLGFHKFAR